MSQSLFTIGVYGTTQARFFAALVENRIRYFVDIRRRRGLRGPEYTYANSEELQKRLGELGIRYQHRLELAPSQETRTIQKEADAAENISGRRRVRLAPEFIESYEEQVLSGFDGRAFLNAFPPDARIVFFCVESDPRACHRSLLAERLAKETGIAWQDITPSS